MMGMPALVRSLAAPACALALALALLSPAAAGAQTLRALDTGSDNGSSSQTSPSPATGAPTSLDPCQIVTSTEASSLAGASYGPGQEETNSGGSRTCVYGAQTLNVFMVLVAQATDPATAQAQWTQEEAMAQGAMQRTLPPGVNFDLTLNDVSDLPGFDRASIAQAGATIAGRPFNIAAIYLLKGATFVTFSDLLVGQPAPTNDALESEAQVVLGRLP